MKHYARHADNKVAVKRKKFSLAKFSARTFIVCSLLAATMLVVGAGIFINGVVNADIPSSPTSIPQRSAITITARDGSTVLATIQPEDGVRETVPSDQISPSMKKAMVAAEDSTFYKNPGFAPQRIAAAAVGHAQGSSTAGGGSNGMKA